MISPTQVTCTLIANYARDRINELDALNFSPNNAVSFLADMHERTHLGYEKKVLASLVARIVTAQPESFPAIKELIAAAVPTDYEYIKFGTDLIERGQKEWALAKERAFEDAKIRTENALKAMSHSQPDTDKQMYDVKDINLDPTDCSTCN